MSIPAEAFFLTPGAGGTLQQQIQQIVAEGVVSGRFRAGERMPSSRKLALQLGVSRITVTLAYTELVAGDYLTALGRSGYFVSDSAPVPRLAAQARVAGPDGVNWARVTGERFSARGIVSKPADWRSYPYPFIYGQADATLFDHQNWRQCALRALGKRDFEVLTDDYHARDDPMLIEFIARNILPRRGISARPEEILLTLGAQNALWLAAQVLLPAGRVAALENPCYPGLRAILGQAQARVVSVDVDAGGLPPEACPRGSTWSSPPPATIARPMRRCRWSGGGPCSIWRRGGISWWSRMIMNSRCHF